MKVNELVSKCGLANTQFNFHEGSKCICKADARTLIDNPKGEINTRTVNTYRVRDGFMEVYLKF